MFRCVRCTALITNSMWAWANGEDDSGAAIQAKDSTDQGSEGASRVDSQAQEDTVQDPNDASCANIDELVAAVAAVGEAIAEALKDAVTIHFPSVRCDARTTVQE